MFLTEAGVVHYLVEQRFADIADVVGGELRVHGISRRNLNFRVAAGKRQYLVKQVRKWDEDGRASIEREAAVYWQAKTNPALAPVAALAPECHAWDPANAILILEYLPAHTDLFDLTDRFDPAIASIAGKAMGCFHRAMRDEKHREQFPAEIPWYVSMHDIDPDDLKDESAGRKELLGAVRKYSQFGTALERARVEWRAETVIQGDWKLGNCLIPAARDRLRLVDWEFACWGDPVWDLATLLQSYWNFWVLSPSQYRIEDIQPALRAVLEGYAQPGVSQKAIRFAGVRMLQTAWECLDKADRMTADAVRLMQASLNILTRPEWAAEQLLGQHLQGMT
jgi:Ser/Thr protein kinase RdoA (MazF antagonist)